MPAASVASRHGNQHHGWEKFKPDVPSIHLADLRVRRRVEVSSENNMTSCCGCCVDRRLLGREEMRNELPRLSSTIAVSLVVTSGCAVAAASRSRGRVTPEVIGSGAAAQAAAAKQGVGRAGDLLYPGLLLLSSGLCFQVRRGYRDDGPCQGISEGTNQKALERQRKATGPGAEMMWHLRL